MQTNTLTIALASLLAGGVATAAYVGHRAPVPQTQAGVSETVPAAATTRDDRRPDDAIAVAASPRLEYAEVISAEPVTERRPIHGTVIATSPVRETVSVDAPREVCEDVVVEERLPERDGNAGGTVAGALIGGLVGNQVGDGDGRKAATVAGAAVGGYIGNRIDRRHEGGKVVTRTERQCRTVADTRRSERTVAWDVTYRTPDGRTATRRTERKPGARIVLGSDTRVSGYDVTYRYRGEEHRLRMDRDPGAALPVVGGRVVTGTAPIGATARG